MTQLHPTPAKPFWQSTTLQGIALTALGAFVPQLAPLVGISDATAVGSIHGVAVTVGTIMGVIGRLKAKHSLK